MKIFVLNVGSSTYKSALFDVKASEDVTTLWQETIKVSQEENPQQILIDLLKKNTYPIEAVGHRVVHGGEEYLRPVIINETVKAAIRRYAVLAPLHNLENLKGIEAMQQLFPGVPQIAVFDTSYHASMPDYAYTYPIPAAWRAAGIRRYGFHGISHEYCAKRAAVILKLNLADLKMVTCHLGNGSSLTAISEGRSIDTTMGFTPLEGVMMGTRCGSIDPGILLYLLKNHKMPVEEVDHCLNFASGLKGICAVSDMQEVLKQRDKGEQKAILAYEMFLHSLIKNLGGMLGILGGADVVVFAGGIGENIPELREYVCQKLHLPLDPYKNNQPHEDREITLPHSKTKVLVIHTREELAIAQACFSLLQSSS